MKKIIYCLAILGLIFTGCNPLDDIYSDIDGKEIAGRDFIKGSEVYTFTDEDYELYEAEIDSVEYFASQDLADVVIPDFLANKYPVWGEGSLVTVGYNLFDKNELEMMSTTETLSNLNQVDGYLGSNYETASNGTFLELTYNANILTYELSDNDFESIGNSFANIYPEPASSAGNFGNFDRRSDREGYWSEDMILEALYELLGDEYNVGQVIAVTYAIYDGGTNFSETFFVQNSGYAFLKKDITAETSGTATAYTLSGTDYNAIGADVDLEAAYPVAVENLNTYGNFNRTGGSTNWTDDMLIEAFNIILPAATEDELYAVTFSVYNGSNSEETITLVYTGSEYAPKPFVAEVTSVVAKNNGDWEFPYVFTKADYTLLEQSFGNFSSSSIYRLDIFLKSLFPFAQVGDVTPVQYRYYDGSTNTKYGTSIFDGDKWNLTPDIIETTFQYGFEDGEWIPDNTINYTLLAADVALISNAFIEIYPGPADNVGFFGSFDRRESSDNYWNDDMLLEVANVLLDAKDPGALEGQKYVLNLVVYTGSTVIEGLSVIKTGGVWVAK